MSGKSFDQPPRPQLASSHTHAHTYHPANTEQGVCVDHHHRFCSPTCCTHRCHTETPLQLLHRLYAHQAYNGRKPPVRTSTNTTVNTGLSMRSATCAAYGQQAVCGIIQTCCVRCVHLVFITELPCHRKQIQQGACDLAQPKPGHDRHACTLQVHRVEHVGARHKMMRDKHEISGGKGEQIA